MFNFKGVYMKCKTSEILLTRIKEVNKNQILGISRSEQTGTTLRFKDYSLFYLPKAPLVVFTFSNNIGKSLYNIYLDDYFLDLFNPTEEELIMLKLEYPLLEELKLW